MAADPRLTAAEWKRISAVLPASTRVGRPAYDDRRAVAELLYFEVEARSRGRARRCRASTGDRGPVICRCAGSDGENGTWQRLMDAGRPALVRWRRRRHRGDTSDTAKVMRSFERQLDA